MLHRIFEATRRVRLKSSPLSRATRGLSPGSGEAKEWCAFGTPYNPYNSPNGERPADAPGHNPGARVRGYRVAARGKCLSRDARTCVCGVQPREEKDALGCNPSARSKAPSAFAKPHSAGAIHNRRSPLPASPQAGRSKRRIAGGGTRGPGEECLRRDARTCVCGVQPREEKDALGCNPSARSESPA